MKDIVLSKVYEGFPFCEKEILRYAGCKNNDPTVSAILTECITEIQGKLSYKVCYRELDFKTDGKLCDFGLFDIESEKLALNLKNCSKVILFAATLGIGLDRLIAKYSRVSPLKALIFQSIGAQQIEALCDCFSADIEKEYNSPLCPRFSPGYGDLPLDAQKMVFRFLEPERRIGLTLNSSSVMSPTKSVTGFVGIRNE